MDACVVTGEGQQGHLKWKIRLKKKKKDSAFPGEARELWKGGRQPGGQTR